MSSNPRFFSQIEPLEARIAPALLITNPLPNIVAGPGKTGATIDLTKLTATAATDAYHTKVQFTTNYDTDPNTAGIQAGIITIELFDDTAPLTVQNFLSYVNNPNPAKDYDGTIIHRSAALSGIGAVNIIQGGGYDFPGFAHIPTAPPVHNEYGAANAPYTIAMANSGPNTATSEWFFNKTDNSTDLDPTNNGGFTVFGKVTDAASKAVIDGIAALTVQDFSTTVGSAFGTLPLQNYNADPDNNPATPKPLPTADQVIRIVDAKTLPATTGTAAGLTFSVEHIYQVAAGGTSTTIPSDLLTAAISGGTKLNLKYTAGKSGFADVVVKVSNGTDPAVTDTFRVDVRPNLLVAIDSDVLPFAIVPGDTTTLKLRLTNTGAALAKGLVSFQFALAKLSASTDASGNLVLSLPDSPTTIPLPTIGGVSVSVGGGSSQVISTKLQIPTALAPNNGDYYQIIVKVVPTGGTASDQRATDDDAARNGGSHQLFNEFGSFTVSHQFNGKTVFFGRANAVLKYLADDAAGGDTLASWSVKGLGFGTITPDGKSLQTSSTTAASTVAVTVPVGRPHVKLQGINFVDFLGSATLGAVDVTGLIAISSGIKTLTLGDLTGESLLLIGPVLPDNSVKAAITLGGVTDFSIESSMPLASLTTTFWHDTTGTAKDSITAPSLGTLKVNGNFESDVTLTDDLATTAITVTGRLHNATISTAGNLGAVTLGGIDFGNVFAGVDARPDALSDFAEARTIQSFTIAGIPGYTGSLFISSQVAAQTIGAIKVKGVYTTNQGNFGFVADVIKSYSRTGLPGQPAVTRSNLTTPQTVDDFGAVGGYAVQIL